jgi:hypothetical protein
MLGLINGINFKVMTMIRKTCFTAAMISGLLVASAAQAKTFTYEIQDINSFQGGVSYPGLDLNGATSGKLVIKQDSPQDTPSIYSLEVQFPSAVKFTARNFQDDGGQIYRTSVNNVWVYRQLNVELHGFDVNQPNEQFVNIEGVVAEGKGFISDDIQPTSGQSLFHVDGRLVNVTPTKVIDREVLTVDGNRLVMSLRDGLTTNNAESFIVINSLWFGNGEQDLLLPSGFPNNVSGFVQPFRINLETFPGSEGDEYFISVDSKDEYGTEVRSPSISLSDVLNQAYNGF